MSKTKYAISHCNRKEQEALIKLKNNIVSLYRPQLVYCLGTSSVARTSRNCFSRRSNSTGWLFSCDLLIILPTGTQVSEATTRNMEQVCEAYEDIRLLVHNWDYVVGQLQIYSLFFCWLQQKAILLYEKDNASSMLPVLFTNIRQYALQAEQYYADNPEYEQYTEPKLSPLPLRVTPSTSPAENTTLT